MVRAEKRYSDNALKMMHQTGEHWVKNTPKQDSLNEALENAREKAHADYNDYWFRYHEKKGDVRQMINPDFYGRAK